MLRGIIIFAIVVSAASYFLEVKDKADEGKVLSTLSLEEIAENRKAYEKKQKELRLEKERQRATEILETMKNNGLGFSVRLGAKKRLEKDFPDFVKEHSADFRAFATLQKGRGVNVGMTQEDILASSWGKPTKVNRTTYSFGVHEQWVYRGGNYLYLEDGILTSIQN